MADAEASKTLADFLWHWLPTRRWYAGKARNLIGLIPYDQIEMAPGYDLVLM